MKTLRSLLPVAYYLISGFSIGYIWASLAFTPTVWGGVDLLKKHEDRTLGELSAAIEGLYNCAHYQKAWPRAREPMRLLFNRSGIAFAYGTTANPSLAGSYAVTQRSKHLIVLTNFFFAEDSAMRIKILAHEMIHMSTPPMSVAATVAHNNGAYDIVYQTTDLCFPNVKATP